MIAAIYARKSTDQNVPDEEKSVTRQVEHARAYAAKKGWGVANVHVYADDGISGAEFIKRPGYLTLMNALRPKPAFQVLIVMDQSRLGRSLDEVPYALKRIGDAGVRVFCYLTDSEIKRETAVDRFLVNAIAFVDDMHREQSRQRTRDAMRRKAAHGHVAGGVVFAYRNVRRNGHVEREIIPEEAEIVRRLFREIAEGRGYLKIAQRLNADGIPGPWGRLWAGSSIRAMIFRDLHRGQLVYGKTRWEDRNGTKLKVDAPPREWITVEAPALRIVPEELWQAAHQRLVPIQLDRAN